MKSRTDNRLFHVIRKPTSAQLGEYLVVRADGHIVAREYDAREALALARDMNRYAERRAA